MTPVGHTIFGATFALGGRSSEASPGATAALVVAAALCANVPDLPLPGWGHERYRISHSIFVGMGLIFVAAAIYAVIPGCRTRLGGWRVFLICAAAWLSHYLLDSLYNHGKGLAMFWPISEARLALPIPWFSIVGRNTSPFEWHAIKTCGIELLCYGGLLCGVVFLRSRMLGKFKPVGLNARRI